MAWSYPAAELSDQEVIVVVRAGDVEAFAVLVDRHHAPLLRYLTRQTGNPDLAADLAQEAFLDAFRHLYRLDERRSFAAWLFGIAQNHLRVERRRGRLRQFVSLDWLPGAALVPALRQADASGPCHEQDAIQRALAGLSPSLRDAVLLHGLAGFTAPEVAQILGVTLPAAERRISRAKAQFRERYREMSQDGRPR